MALLKEDGSLDIERINQLPIEEYMEEIGSFSNKQVLDYISTIALDEKQEPFEPSVAEYSIEHYGIDADDILNKIKKVIANKK